MRLNPSHPTWVRELKRDEDIIVHSVSRVAPNVGA